MLKLMPQTPSKTYHVRLAHSDAGDLAADVPSRNSPISRRAPREHGERASIIIGMLHDLRNDKVHSSSADEHAALEELRRHVTQCILDTCLKRELASPRDEDSYFTKNLSDLAAIGRFMADLTRGDPEKVTESPLSLEEAIKIVANLFVTSTGKIHVSVDMPKLTFSTVEFHVLMSVGLELVLNSVRHAFYERGTGQVSVSLKVTNNGQDVELCVTDNGYGPDRLSFGRGLRLVSRVSAVVAGDIAVRRQPYGGTGIALTFPRTRTRRQRSQSILRA